MRDDLGVIDVGPLEALLAQSSLLRLREHFFVRHGLPYVLCVVTHRPSSATTPRDQAQPSAVAEARPARERIDLDLAAQSRFEHLRRWRATRARAHGVPAYVLFTNRELAAIAARQPTTRAELLQIAGVGDGKAARYGDELLAQIGMVATTSGIA